MNVVTLGDMLLDVIVRREQPRMTGRDVPADTRVSVGGQAANVAAWVAALGGDATFVGARGDDVVARLGAAELYNRGVRLRGPVVSGDCGTVVAILDAVGEPEMMSDRGVSSCLGAADLDPEWFAGADRLHISGYGLLSEGMAEAIAVASRIARSGGARVSVDLAAAPMIRLIGPEIFASRLAATRAEVLFGTPEEFEALPYLPTPPVIVVKDGANGVTVRTRGKERHVAAPDVSVADTTGAGDAFAAGFLLGTSPDDALTKARRAAGICISRVGAMPPSDLHLAQVAPA